MVTFVMSFCNLKNPHLKDLKERLKRKEIGGGKKKNKNGKKEASRIISREDKTQHSKRKGKAVGEEVKQNCGAWDGLETAGRLTEEQRKRTNQ